MLLEVAHHKYRSKVEAITLPKPRGEMRMVEAISHYLKGFRTQKAGGFITDEGTSRNKVARLLHQQITDFNGLVFGIECPQNSIIRSLPHSYLNGELVVYAKDVQISPQRIARTGTFPDGGQQKILLQEFNHEGKRILTGHFSSGTQDPLRDPFNRDLFLSICRKNKLSGTDNIDISSYFASFFDANFDVTDIQNITHLLSTSMNTNLQMAFPAVRVEKQRIANAPFENNQLNKGGKKKTAESMIMVTDKKRKLVAGDIDLYVIHSGKIFRLHKNTLTEVSLNAVAFIVYQAISPQVLLDHVPIHCSLDKQWMCFHNFMEFKGVRGIEEGWYEKPEPFGKAQQNFIDWLAVRFLS